MADPLVVALLAASLVLGLTVAVLVAIARRLSRSLAKAVFERRSLAVRHGTTLEQLAPFLEGFPYDPRGFRFLGNPVDGIHFGEDEILFLEFKSGEARLSDRQKRIRGLVEDGRVRFVELRLTSGSRRGSSP
ncbi:MAG: Holliday junction resolvase-like protein [Methanobacteriota archaeon]